MLHHVCRMIAPLALLALLSGCILVNDFAPMWEKAKPDPCLSKLSESIYYSEFRRDPSGLDIDEHAHAFSLGNHHFLMLKKEVNDTGGRLYRFRVINGIFQRFRLDPVMREAFEIEFPDAPVSFKHDTVTVETLDTPVTDLLREIASRDTFWEIEEQNLYNILRNPLCRFDDRDLEALEAAEKPKAKP
jgi:hypothetical protein